MLRSRRIGEIHGLANVDAVVARARGEVVGRQHEPALALVARLANTPRIVCQVGNKLVRSKRGDACDARVGALVALEAHVILRDRIGNLRGGDSE